MTDFLILVQLLYCADSRISRLPLRPGLLHLYGVDVFTREEYPLNTSRSHETDKEVLREGAAGIDVGPAGSRIVIATLLASESGVAVRKSWDEATELLDSVSQGFISGFSSGDEFEAHAAPAGCVEAKRLEGIEDLDLLPVGATMCAVEPDSNLVSVVYGTCNGQDGVSASDTATSITLRS
jgi:hypothetical protein